MKFAIANILLFLEVASINAQIRQGDVIPLTVGLIATNSKMPKDQVGVPVQKDMAKNPKNTTLAGGRPCHSERK